MDEADARIESEPGDVAENDPWGRDPSRARWEERDAQPGLDEGKRGGSVARLVAHVGDEADSSRELHEPRVGRWIPRSRKADPRLGTEILRSDGIEWGQAMARGEREDEWLFEEMLADEVGVSRRTMHEADVQVAAEHGPGLRLRGERSKLDAHARTRALKASEGGGDGSVPKGPAHEAEQQASALPTRGARRVVFHPLRATEERAAFF